MGRIGWGLALGDVQVVCGSIRLLDEKRRALLCDTLNGVKHKFLYLKNALVCLVSVWSNEIFSCD